MCSSIVEDMYLKFVKVLKPEFIFQMQTFKMCFDKHRLSSKALSVTCGDEFWHTLVECSWYLPMKWGNSVRQNPTEDQTRFCQMDPSHRMCLQMCNILMTRIKGDYREFVPNWDDATPEAICYKIKEIHPDEVLYGKEEGSGDGSGDGSTDNPDNLTDPCEEDSDCEDSGLKCIKGECLMDQEYSDSDEGSDSEEGSDSKDGSDSYTESCEVDSDCVEECGRPDVCECKKGYCEVVRYIEGPVQYED